MGTGAASEKKYSMTVDKDVWVTMRDGIRIPVDIYRPDAQGKFPALLAMSVYGKNSQVFETPPQPFGKSIFEASCESGDPKFYAERGYAYAIADFRGTGHSEGEHIGCMSKQEGEDGYDVVEFLAKQPWCDGGVGLAGICYFANAQLRIATEQPPSLKCIAPWEIYGDDLYEHGMYPGGVLDIFWYGLYTGTYPARCGYAISNVKSWMIENTPPDELKKLVDKFSADPDLRQYPYLYHLLQYPGKNPLLFDFMLNPLYNQFWKDRSIIENIDKINVPAYVGGPFFSFFMDPQINVFNRLNKNVPKKAYFYADMGVRPWYTDHDELLRWYDYWLKGIDTGIMDEPDVRYFTSGLGKWQGAKQWPVETAHWEDFYFHSLGGLSPEPDLFNDHPDSFVQEPLFVTEERGRVSYVSPPMPEDVQVTGAPRVKFYAAIDQDDTCWRVDIREADSDAVMSLSTGWLRASLRKRLCGEDTPWSIAHDFTQFDFVEPGGIYEYEIQLRPFSHLFRTGKQIKIEISCIDIPTDASTYDVYWHVCKARTTLHKIYRDADHRSKLSLPVVQG